MNSPRISYLRDKNNKPFGVLAVKLDCENNTILYALSVCHSVDTFDKTKGIKIATAHLESDPLKVLFIRVNGMSAHEITRHVMYDIYQRRTVSGQDLFGTFTVKSGVPTRARKFAKTWLKGYSQKSATTKEEDAPASDVAAYSNGFQTMSRTLEKAR